VSLPARYRDAIVNALAALRGGRSAFASGDGRHIFGDWPHTCALPSGTTPADCADWVGQLTFEELEHLSEELVGLPSDLRQPIREYARSERRLQAGSLAALDAPLVVNRDLFLAQIRRLRRGARMLRVGGASHTGMSYTTELLIRLLGSRAGSDQRVIPISVMSYPTLQRVVTQIVRAAGISGELPEFDNATEDKYPEEAAELIVSGIKEQTRHPPECTWLVFDRCRDVPPDSPLASFLYYIAQKIEQHRDDDGCPRVVFLEIEGHLLPQRQPNNILVEHLGKVGEADIRTFLERRGIAEPARTEIADQVWQAMNKYTGRAQLAELQSRLEDLLQRHQAGAGA
jgi:hypothetical protein